MQGTKLKPFVDQAKLTYRQLAELTGISESTVSRILAGQVEPKYSDVAAIAKVVGASLDDIAGIIRPEDEEIKELRIKVMEQDAEIRSQASVIVSHARDRQGRQSSSVPKTNRSCPGDSRRWHYRRRDDHPGL